MAKYFTREEAERLLPHLEPFVRDLQQRYPAFLALKQELAHLQQRMQGNGHGLHQRLERLTGEYQAATEEINRLIKRITGFGCQLKDPAMGLLDFPTLREGHEVLLCWRLGEARISWWHETTTGFAGRQPLED